MSSTYELEYSPPASLPEHEKPEFVEQQFEDAEQQKETALLGMWTFLATEVLFFGAIFAAYTICRTRWPVAFMHGSQDLYLWIGGSNTVVLLTSSFFMALAVRSASLGHMNAVFWFLIVTIGLGVSFLGLKAFEYAMDASDHTIPILDYSTVSPEDARKPPDERALRPEQEQLFMCFYFIMTAIHALHMIVGISLLSVMAVMTRMKRFSKAYHNPIEVAGLYWHFVDIVWLFIFPTLYLLRQS